MKNLRRLLPISLFLGLIASLFWSFNWTATLNSTYDAANQGYRFWFTGIPPAPADTTDDYDNWRVFLNFDDGTYWMGTKLQFENTCFPLGSNRNYHVMAELTPTYDDGGTSPGKYANNLTVGSTQTNSNWNQRFVQPATGKNIRLSSTRSPKLGDIITFIVTVKNPTSSFLDGAVNFYYSTAALNLVGSTDPVATCSGVSGTSLSQLTYSSTGNTPTADYTKVSIPVQLAGNELRNIFIPCTTKNLATPPAYVVPFAELIGNNKTRVDSNAMSAQAIVTGHDPNHKYAAEQTLCMDADSVTFTISFQNDGAGPIDSIVVIDPMDYLLKKVNPRLVSYSGSTKPLLDNASIPNGVIKYTFYPIDLPGLYDPDLQQNGKNENDTQVSFTFRCALDHDKTSQFPCSAVLNQAQVYFDCNPPVKTNLAMVHLQCTACAACAALPDTAFVVDSIPGTDSLLQLTTWGSFLVNQASSGTFTGFKWYPPNSFSPAVNYLPKWNNTAVDPEAYLVMSGTCQYQLAKFKMPTRCNLDIQLDMSHFNIDSCARQFSGYITAHATGNFSDAANLQWQECDKTGATYQMNADSRVMKYHFGLTDKMTGCYVEKTYTVRFPRCTHFTLSEQLIAALALIVVVGGLLYFVFAAKPR